LKGIFAVDRDKISFKPDGAKDSLELETLKASSRLFFRSNSSAMLILSFEGIICEANPEVCRLLQYEEKELCGKKHDQLFDKSDVRLEKAIETFRATSTLSAELKCMRKDGATFPVSVSASAFLDIDGLNKVNMLIRDISDQKKIEEFLRASEAMLKEAQQIAHIGHWELNFVTDSLTWSDEVYNIYEVDRDTFATSFDPFFNMLTTEEKNRVKETYAASVKLKPQYDVVHRFNFDGGRVKYVNETCKNFYDDNGNLLRSVGTVQDITTRWLTEERLRQLSRAVEQSPVCVVITDTDSNITYVNPKFSELTGYSYEEALGENPRILKTSITPPETFKSLWESLLKGEKWSGEFCNKKKNGDLYWEMAYISPVVNSEGEITHYVAVKENITARKKADEQLRELSLLDELTGLTNRRGFYLLAKQQIKVADRNRRGVVLIFADMDGMKYINDTFGHKEGDQALIDAACIIKRVFRASDIIARLGGDEFVALSVEASDESKENIQARLRENLEVHNLETTKPYKLSISIGITVYDPAAPCSLDELIERGDKLMYENKQKRKQAQAGKV
jgi:diguanylate cyclase (GGDEF)-like protein/PAS domain S-box-containing protein